MNLPWWTPGDTAQSIWIYFDGSASRNRERTGCGVAAYILDGEWKFAGALSTPLQAGATSYGAEATGAALAIKFLFDLLKLLPPGTQPEAWMCYDSTSVGEQLVGNWGAIQWPELFAFIRNTVLLIEHRYQVQVRHHHIYGHTGEPGNAIVDVLADTLSHLQTIFFLGFYETLSKQPLPGLGSFSARMCLFGGRIPHGFSQLHPRLHLPRMYGSFPRPSPLQCHAGFNSA